MRTLVTGFAALVFGLSSVGCLADSIGPYRVDSSSLMTASCGAGVEPVAAQTWAAALDAAPVSDIEVAGDFERGPQLQMKRADASWLYVNLQSTGDWTFAGERSLEATTVSDSGLGADFSALLEGEQQGCRFDLTMTADIGFDDGAWVQMAGNLQVELRETLTPVDSRCSVQDCSAQFWFQATHLSFESAPLLPLDTATN